MSIEELSLLCVFAQHVSVQHDDDDDDDDNRDERCK